MSIVVVGLNYRTAPVEIREQLTFSDDEVQVTLDDLRSLRVARPESPQPVPVITEAVILSTCNRLEVYISTPYQNDGAAAIEQFLARLRNITVPELKRHLYRYTDDKAINHLMRVASGLDSMILGETQILGQVTDAFKKATSAGMTGPILSHLFAQVIHTGKRARTETSVSRYSTSISHAGVQLLMQKLDQPHAARCLIIGAGEMAGLAAQALQHFDLHEITFINRTFSRAQALAQDFESRALRWEQLREGLLWADAIICATSAPHTVLYHRDMEAVLEQRVGRPLVIMDLAVPRDVEASVRELPGIQYYDIDELQSVVDTNVELRRAAIPQVESIIQAEMLRFSEWYHGREVTPVIKNLREWAQNIADEELGQTLNRLSDTDDRTREIVSHMAHRLVNRLLHEPTSRLRIQANDGNGYGYTQAVRELFGLNDLDALECQCAAGQTDYAAHKCNLQCIIPSSIGHQP